MTKVISKFGLEQTALKCTVMRVSLSGSWENCTRLTAFCFVFKKSAAEWGCMRLQQLLKLGEAFFLQKLPEVCFKYFEREFGWELVFSTHMGEISQGVQSMEMMSYF